MGNWTLQVCTLLLLCHSCWMSTVQQYPLIGFPELHVTVANNFLNESDIMTLGHLLSSAPDEEWLYTTNTGPRGSKVRSNERVIERRMEVERANRVGHFCYSKSELDSSHTVVRELKRIFERQQVMERVSNLLDDGLSHTVKPRFLTDLFIAKYTAEELLSWHGDGPAGSIAFVLGLTEGWDSVHDGGGLQFQCVPRNDAVEDDENVCLELSPAFNTLTLFRTRYRVQTSLGVVMQQVPILHRVDRVRSSKSRITVTGWYMVEGDELNREEARICEEMKGSSCVPNDGRLTNEL